MWIWKAKGMQGGFFQDIALAWGGVRAGSIFFRAITTLVVHYVTHRLIHEWVPTIEHPEVLTWIKTRLDAGYSKEQALPAFIRGFLDDYFSFIAGTDEDHERAMNIIHDSFIKLKLKVSTKKEMEEGGLRKNIDILGLNIQLDDFTMGVPAHKVRRLIHMFNKLLTMKKWPQILLSQALGLLESVKIVIPRRIRMSTLYRILHSQGSINPLRKIQLCPSPQAIEIVQRTLHHLHERRSIWWRPTA